MPQKSSSSSWPTHPGSDRRKPKLRPTHPGSDQLLLLLCVRQAQRSDIEHRSPHRRQDRGGQLVHEAGINGDMTHVAL
jgi:hypothetical protein